MKKIPNDAESRSYVIAGEGAFSTEKPQQMVMIGDTTEDGHPRAFEAGLCSFLVLTGSKRLEEIRDYAYQPTRTLSSVAALAAELNSGAPSSRLDSPALLSLLRNGKCHGKRHQTDFENPRRSRPMVG